MPSPVKVVAFAGSLRKDSYNKKLARVAAAAARAAGAEVTEIDLSDLPMPIYDEDDEKAGGIPANAKKFKELLKSHHAMLIASPEYNSSVSAALKNAIDWASRPEPGEPPLAAFSGKVAGIMAASPGALGGLRGLVTLRSILGNIQVLVVPDQVAINTANEQFNTDGSLKDAKKQQAVEKIAQRVVEVARKLHTS